MFHPRAPSGKVRKGVLQSGHVASWAWAVGDGVIAGVTCVFLFRWKDDMADMLDEGRAFRAISFFSTRGMTSFTALCSMSLLSSISRRMSES